jgi:hypothetical protein
MSSVYKKEAVEQLALSYQLINLKNVYELYQPYHCWLYPTSKNRWWL